MVRYSRYRMSTPHLGAPVTCCNCVPWGVDAIRAVSSLTVNCFVRSGGKELALELEEKGYGWLEAPVGG